MILVIGSKGHANVVIDIIEQQGKYNIFGLIDPNEVKGKKVGGYKILGGEEAIPSIIKENKIKGGVIAIGDNWLRGEVEKKILAYCSDFNFISCVHPNSYVAKTADIKKGSVVMAGAIVNANTTVGEHCIVNNNASIDHDSVLNNFSSVAPGATLGGNVRIGKFSAISLGANLIHNIEVGEHSLVGAGALVTSGIGSQEVVFGSPAKKMRSREIGEKYL